jgi:hypothetical protein
VNENVMNRRELLTTAVVGALSAVPFGALACCRATQCERELTISLRDGKILCETRSRVLSIGDYKFAYKKGFVTIDVRMDDNASETIMRTLEAEGFIGTVTLSL